jgi:hypothetical protein
MADLTLKGASIRFNTHSDDKDHDTRLSVTIKNKVNMFMSEVIAEDQNLASGKKFEDPSTYQFDLPLVDSSVKMSDLALPVVSIKIQPNGHDRWIFDYNVSLVFGDGDGPTKTFSSGKQGVILDQDNKEYVGTFEG